MENSAEMEQKAPEQTGWEKTKGILGKVDRVVDIILSVLYRLRKVFLAIPVAYYAIKLARYNMENLPQVIGVNMQANGAFAEFISRDLAVWGPLGVTAACLVLMFLSRKALYPWAISIFTLALPLLLLISNRYPA